MKTFGSAALAAALALTAGAALADDGHGRRGAGGSGMYGAQGGGHDMMQMMKMHSGMAGSGGMPGMGMMGAGGMPMMGGMSMMAMMERFDADGDGTVTPEELRTALQGLLQEYDADGNGTLSLDEFETLHSAMMREATVDRFQFLDNDGDGEVTPEEMATPADRMERMQEMRNRMMSGPGGSAASAGQPGMMNGNSQGMMQDDDASGMMEGNGMEMQEN
ncbi:EF-hand domain-containing protein [Tranquillimonas alkanivorans]|uniref:EF hand n=1 Tax=Tranquillimonas alkanivorans TaxID=441119 RepID=A0A1I5V4J4_9RHOB|nr:hypothetical protein [Tranquillimonas alkanivorans]SFQ02361.1 EF hand [Tranquillimonas alkanivorans]